MMAADTRRPGDRLRLIAAERARESAGSDLAPELPFDEIWTPEPDAKLVIPGLGIAPGPTHLVTGSWYTGKTLVLITLGMCIASGKPLFDGLWETRRGKWTHFDYEMGRRHMKRYFQRLANGLGLTPDDVRDNVSLRVLPELNLCHDQAIDHYTRILEGSSIATIDPLRAAAPGQDENSSEFRRWQDRLAIVSDRTKCAILLLHHGGKPVEGSARRNTGRGSSAIDDAAQSKFVLTAKEKGAPILVSHEKTRELTQPVDDFYLEIDNSVPGAVRLAHRNAEEMLEREEVSVEVLERAKTDKAKTSLRNAVSVFGMDGFSGTRQALLSLVRGDRNTNSRALSEMLSSGQFRADGRGESRKWYAV